MPALQAADPIDAYPPAENGMTRHVLTLPEENDESLVKIELILGKTVKIDAANRYFFGGKIETKTVEGWGYPYHILPEIGPMAGTLMAIPPDLPKTERFIAIGGEAYLMRYNSTGNQPAGRIYTLEQDGGGLWYNSVTSEVKIKE